MESPQHIHTELSEAIARTCDAAARVTANVEQVIIGKREVVELVLVALLCEGHILMEDVPGMGKTLLSKAVARSLDGSFKRVQFTSDLLPSDVTGLNYFNPKSGEFQFQPGPIMANVVLADEINRATPRTQACLLEAMQERQVTVDGETRDLPRPFIVLATQNPVEQAGTFPLPEAQLDRFLVRIHQGYPSFEAENQIITRFRHGNPLETLEPVLSGRDLLAMKKACRDVYVEDSLREYIVRIIRATRTKESIRLGASPRATQALYAAVQVRAALNGRDFVIPDDIKYLASPVLAHRLVLKPEAGLRGQTKEDMVNHIVQEIDVPVV
ncbi:MAG: MoxR family ATPase [Pseudomonadota bacterium]